MLSDTNSAYDEPSALPPDPVHAPSPSTAPASRLPPPHHHVPADRPPHLVPIARQGPYGLTRRLPERVQRLQSLQVPYLRLMLLGA